MATIQQRVAKELAKIAKREADEARKAQAPANRRMGQLIARDQRIENLIDGKVEPRNRKEAELVARAEFAGEYL